MARIRPISIKETGLAALGKRCPSQTTPADVEQSFNIYLILRINIRKAPYPPDRGNDNCGGAKIVVTNRCKEAICPCALARLSQLFHQGAIAPGVRCRHQGAHQGIIDAVPRQYAFETANNRRAEHEKISDGV